MNAIAVGDARPAAHTNMNGCPVFVSADVSRSIIPWNLAINALTAAYEIPHLHGSVPPRTVARGNKNWLRTLSAIPPGSRFMGAKVFGMGPEKAVNYAIVLIEQSSGIIASIVDGAAITAIRTAATSAVALNRLAKPGPLRLGVLGSGDEARAHLEAAAAVRPISSVAVFSPRPARREAFASQCIETLDIECTAVASPETLLDCDVLIAAARSRDEKPIIYSSMMRPGMLTISIGSTLPEQREVDVSAVAACDLIVCDAVEEVISETGDMIAASAAGIEFDSKIISLNTLISGQADARVKAARQIMYKSVGSALQDVVIATLSFERAQTQGLSDQLPVRFYTKHV